MKKLYFTVSLLFISVVLFAQTIPEKFSYQAVIRDNNNEPVANQQVGMKISILQTSPTGTVVYEETHNITSNENGLVMLEIGNGSVVSGSFGSIDWTNGPYFIMTQADPSGGSNYTISHTSELLSVPYALHAATAESLTGVLPGITFTKLHTEDELDLELGGSIGPNVQGSSTGIGDISQYDGLLLEWRMLNRPEVFHQIIYLSDYDKDIILGNIPEPTDYPRRYTTIVSDDFGTIMWIGVSIEGDRLYISTNSEANPRIRLQRIYGFK